MPAHEIMWLVYTPQRNKTCLTPANQPWMFRYSSFEINLAI